MWKHKKERRQNNSDTAYYIWQDGIAKFSYVRAVTERNIIRDITIRTYTRFQSPLPFSIIYGNRMAWLGVKSREDAFLSD